MNKKFKRRTAAFSRETAPVRSPTTLLQKAGLVLFGICLCLVLLESGLRMGGAVFLFFQESQNLRSLRAHGYRIMCLGESTTADQYPRFLNAELNRRGQGIPFSVIDKGMPSVNTDVILAQLEANLDKYKPDLVVAMMGINDQGEYMPQEPRSSSGFVRWLFSLRVVKLARLLELHLRAKAKEPGAVKPPAVQVPGPSKLSIEVAEERMKNFGLTHFQELLDVSGNGTPMNEQILLSEAWKALSEGNPERAEKMFHSVLAENPRNAQAYYGLAWIPRNTFYSDEQEALLLKVIDLKPEEAAGYQLLGDLYLFENKYERAEASYKKAQLFNPNIQNVVFSLVYIYMMQKRFDDAEQALKLYLTANPEDDRCYRRLILFYHETGRREEAAAYEKKERSLDNDFHNVFTVTNYRKLKTILDRRKIKLVCAQYPMRNIAGLKNIFASRGGVFFVDNEKVFKAAVAGGRLHEYFVDMFAGDFGHCTDLGNELLAKQIANVILKEVLGMK